MIPHLASHLNSHLTASQLSEFLAGQPDGMVERHIQTCPACRAEVAAFREALAGLRGAVHAWSEQQAEALARPPARPEGWFWKPAHQLACALAIAAICAIVSLVSWHGREVAARSDTVLLDQVDSQVSRSVPSSLEPLLRLVVQQQ
jgi:anti-sigma factor RsiW